MEYSTLHTWKTGFHVQSKQQSRNIDWTLYVQRTLGVFLYCAISLLYFRIHGLNNIKIINKKLFSFKKKRKEKKKNNIENIVFTTLRLRFSRSGAFANANAHKHTKIALATKKRFLLHSFNMTTACIVKLKLNKVRGANKERSRERIRKKRSYLHATHINLRYIRSNHTNTDPNSTQYSWLYQWDSACNWKTKRRRRRRRNSGWREKFIQK